MTYIWQHSAWPNFSYEKPKVERELTELYTKAGQLAGLNQASPRSEAEKNLATELADELTSSFAIEGETIEHNTITESIVASLANRDVTEATSQPYASLAELGALCECH